MNVQLLIVAGVITSQIIMLMLMNWSLWNKRPIILAFVSLLLTSILYVEIHTANHQVEELITNSEALKKKVDITIDQLSKNANRTMNDVRNKIVNFRVF